MKRYIGCPSIYKVAFIQGVHRFENSFQPSMNSTAVQIEPDSLSGMMDEKMEPSELSSDGGDSSGVSSIETASVYNKNKKHVLQSRMFFKIKTKITQK